ncbi:MAG: hypothetical protein LBQ61_04340 [Spirochaetales bacterium]|jgi:hypothetical protein|nr:hypothetical protein [Spirochaetales bacterium]
MAENKQPRRRGASKKFPLIIILLLGGVFLPAQEGEYRLGEDGNFIQVLRWQEEPEALYYEAQIQGQTPAGWEEVLTAAAEMPFIEISLTAGDYRCRILVYDLLGRPAGTSDWTRFEIRPAKDPEIFRFTPEAFYLDEDVTWVLNLTGRNLVEGMDIFLINSGLREGIIRPRTITVDPAGGGARLNFDFRQLTTGEYAIYGVNPGGLETRGGNFRIAFKKPVDINLSGGYRPLLPLYGEIHQLLPTWFFPIGAYGRAGIIPLKRDWGYLGFEIEPAWHLWTSRGNWYEVKAQIIGATLFGVYQKLYNRVLTFSFRLGGGLYAVLDYHLVYSSGLKTAPITILIPVAAAGISVQWFIRKPFFLETGFDFTHQFSRENPQPGYLRPFVGAGWNL